jgi:parallel beta-helix repeat protein/predicted outer membrane repeat protein
MNRGKSTVCRKIWTKYFRVDSVFSCHNVINRLYINILFYTLVIGLAPISSSEPKIPLCSERFPVMAGDVELPFPYSSSRPLYQEDPNVERFLFSIHGVGSDAEMYLNRGLDAAKKTPSALNKTLVIAPQFLTTDDYGASIPPGTLYWGSSRFWGGLSIAAADLGAQVSSFIVLEQILEHVSDPALFPNVKVIVLAGHSGGGQMVNRFAASNQFDNKVAKPLCIHMRYVVMNPSSYVYFSSERVVPETTDKFEIPSSETVNFCSHYNNYGYGLESLWFPYLSEIGADTIRLQYPERNVIYLLGSEDNDPNSDGLDRSCAAMLQGNHRLERGTIYFNYLQYYYGDIILDNQTLQVVPDAGHSGRAMMTSDIGIKYLFDYDFTPSVKYVDSRASAGGNGKNWETAFQHIDDILPFSRSGDEIRVAMGTYIPKLPSDPCIIRTASFILRPGIQLKGGYAGLESPDPNARDYNVYETILSGDILGDDRTSESYSDNCYQVIREASADANTLLEGFTIKGGNADSDIYYRGGGMYCQGDSLTVRFCRFVDNQAKRGGAVYNREGANCRFYHCYFEANRAILSGDGGAVFNDASDPIFENCIFTRNMATDDGGAIRNTGTSHPVYNGCVFFDNSAADNGGAVYSLDSSPIFEACRIVGNHAEDNGGGLYHEGNANSTIINCLFSGNSSFQYGGAVFSHASNPSLLNCTLWKNSAAWQGGGTYSRQNSKVQLINCLFKDNRVNNSTDESAQIDGDIAQIQYSFVQGWTGQLGGIGNFDGEDPLFVDPDGPDDTFGTIDDDLRLTLHSPCIDTGIWLDNVAYDFEGQPRGFDGNPERSTDGYEFDIGYDEYSDVVVAEKVNDI